MILKKSIDYKIGFSDSALVSYSKNDKSLLIIVKAWNEKTIKINFNETIGFLDQGAWEFSDFCEISFETDLLNKALKRQYDVIPENHGYKSFQFLDNNQETVIEIICLNIEINSD